MSFFERNFRSQAKQSFFGRNSSEGKKYKIKSPKKSIIEKIFKKNHTKGRPSLEESHLSKLSIALQSIEKMPTGSACKTARGNETEKHFQFMKEKKVFDFQDILQPKEKDSFQDAKEKWLTNSRIKDNREHELKV